MQAYILFLSIVLYKAVYNPILIYPAPTYLSKEGFEITEVACWDRKVLQNLIKSLEKNKTTEYLEILHFIDKSMDDILKPLVKITNFIYSLLLT